MGERRKNRDMKFWNLKNLGGDGSGGQGPDGVLEITGEIVAEEGWFNPDGVCVARDIRNGLRGLGNVIVRINSPGGDVMAGADIYSALLEHRLNKRGTVTVEISALAASAASVIAMAGDRILMSPTAYMMIHNPWTVSMGNAKEMRKTARMLDEIGEGLINAYQLRTGKSRDELKRMLENETWMSAGTCVEEGFADGILGSETRAAALVRMSGKAHGAAEILARMGRETEAEPATAACSCSSAADARADIGIPEDASAIVSSSITLDIQGVDLGTLTVHDWTDSATNVATHAETASKASVREMIEGILGTLNAGPGAGDEAPAAEPEIRTETEPEAEAEAAPESRTEADAEQLRIRAEALAAAEEAWTESFFGGEK